MSSTPAFSFPNSALRTSLIPPKKVHRADFDNKVDAARAVKRVKANPAAVVAPPIPNRPARIRIPHSSLLQPHRHRGGRALVVVRVRHPPTPVDLVSSVLTALTMQPTGTDAVEYAVLGNGIACMSLEHVKRPHEAEEEHDAFKEQTRPAKRVKIITRTGLPGRVPHSSILQNRTRRVLARVPVVPAASPAVAPTPALSPAAVVAVAAAVTPVVVVVVVVVPLPAPTPGIDAFSTLKDRTNTTGTRRHVPVAVTKIKNRTGGVKRTRKSPSARENAAPFPVSSQRRGSLARGLA
ncbi:hypothetical protein B0H19DRAFT_692757 [Mycena capillaripes]|nr:hypothetical protein B0H19DRAFT_692757 [Mycena capillaripes]